ISDALLRLKHSNGGYLPDITMFSPERQSGAHKIIGPVFTVKFVPISDVTSPKPDNHFADSAPENSVVFVSAPPNAINAVWGGLMNTRAKMRGVNGVVVDGRIRDLSEIRSDVLPVFARSTSVLSAKAYTRPTTLNQPVILNGDHNPTIVINPNDIIVGDLDGVVCIPSGLLDEVIKLCKKYVVMDENVRQELLKGSSIVEAFSLHRAV
ncbi:2964_t:CDS:2, partial [Entrophospora sp. SA101]